MVKGDYVSAKKCQLKEHMRAPDCVEPKCKTLKFKIKTAISDPLNLIFQNAIDTSSVIQ